jgi:glutaredoxin
VSSRDRTVTLYTRAGCCLCDDVRNVLDAAGRRARFRLEVIDVDTDPELRALYGEEVPVVAIDGRKAFRYHLPLDDFLRELERR